MTSSIKREKSPAKSKKRVGRNDPKQSGAFIEQAREVEADEKKSAADKLMGRLAEKEPKPHKPNRGE